MTLPYLVKIRQRIPSFKVTDFEQELLEKLNSKAGPKIQPSMKIAIAVGSRGIARLAEIVKIVSNWLLNKGAKPFIVPAMGSHGQATAQGQKLVLERLGISEKEILIPIRSSMMTVRLGEVQGIPVYFDKTALNAQGIILINRIKPHTSFSARYESGLVKMLAIGLGNKDGAEQMHRLGPSFLAKALPKVGEYIIKKLPLVFGIAILENYKEELARIEVLTKEEIMSKEPTLLKQAYKLMPTIPFSEFEVLIVDELGKEKSGTGMDTNVIGRMGLWGEKELKKPRIKRIVVLNLYGKGPTSGYGLGLADITTKKVIKKIDIKAMRENALTSTFIERARIPLWFESDKDAILASLKTSWIDKPEDIRVVHIKNTLELEELEVTKNLVSKAEAPLEIISKPSQLKFDKNGNLKSRLD